MSSAASEAPEIFACGGLKVFNSGCEKWDKDQQVTLGGHKITLEEEMFFDDLDKRKDVIREDRYEVFTAASLAARRRVKASLRKKIPQA